MKILELQELRLTLIDLVSYCRGDLLQLQFVTSSLQAFGYPLPVPTTSLSESKLPCEIVDLR